MTQNDNKECLSVLSYTGNGEQCESASPPSQPRNLHQTAPDNTPSVTIEWDAPEFTGGYEIQYRIRIPAVMTYSEKKSSTTHTITADGSDVMFNNFYTVVVTAVSTIGESNPVTIDITIVATG